MWHEEDTRGGGSPGPTLLGLSTVLRPRLLERVPQRVREHDVRLLDSGRGLAAVGDVLAIRAAAGAVELDHEAGNAWTTNSNAPSRHAEHRQGSVLMISAGGGE